MTEIDSFADRIRERFPEGLTGIFAIGGTRTTFILEHNQRNHLIRGISRISACTATHCFINIMT